MKSAFRHMQILVHRKMVFGRQAREQILRPGTTYEEQPIIDQADVEHLRTNIEQPADVCDSTALHDPAFLSRAQAQVYR